VTRCGCVGGVDLCSPAGTTQGNPARGTGEPGTEGSCVGSVGGWGRWLDSGVWGVWKGVVRGVRLGSAVWCGLWLGVCSVALSFCGVLLWCGWVLCFGFVVCLCWGVWGLGRV